MKNTHHIEIEAWKKRNSLTRKSQYIPLLEAYRRVNMFHKGDVKATMTLLAMPSEVKGAKEFFSPYSGETPRCLAWYNLTEKGQEVIKDLKLVWNEKEMNNYLFNLYF